MKRIRVHSECQIDEDDILEIFYNISVFDHGLYEILKHKDNYTYENKKLSINWDINLTEEEYIKYKDKLDRFVETEDALYYQTLHSDATTNYTIVEEMI